MLPGFGELGQRRLAAARVLIVGAGGLGCAVAPALAAAGVGTLGLVDDDVVSASNLPRQTAHGEADLGRSKVDSLAETLLANDGSVRIERHPIRLDASNALDLAQRFDVVIDASDNFETRYLLADACELVDRPLIWGSILRYYGQFGLSWTSRGPGYRDLFPDPPHPSEVGSCELSGVLPMLCQTVGSQLATEAVKVIVGLGELLLGRVLTVDALTGRTRESRFERLPARAPVTELGGTGHPLARPMQVGPEVPMTTVAELMAMLRDDEPVRLVDVREGWEFHDRRIPDSELLPMSAVYAGSDPEPGAGPVVVVCEHDPRARYAAGMFVARGVAQVSVLAGGIEAWADLGGPTERGDA